MHLFENIEFSGVKGIGNLKLSLSDERMNVLIGANGVGKTKALESLYFLLLSTNKDINSPAYYLYSIPADKMLFQTCHVNGKLIIDAKDGYTPRDDARITIHNLPVIYLAAQNRGYIKKNTQSISSLGLYEDRKEKYFSSLFAGIKNDFSTLNADTNIEEWFIQRANSSSRYIEESDNREVELLSVLRILNQIDNRISANPNDFKTPGGESVSILVEGERRLLSELSSGFASLIKIIQSIIAGYGFFTNSREPENVEGYVLIDEIESHLHIEWQTKILPLLLDIFPNTRFIITTHSSLVLTQLVEGNAYRLIREKGGVVTEKISAPNQSALIDLLKDAFGVNLNRLKINTTTPQSQQAAKKAILRLLGD